MEFVYSEGQYLLFNACQIAAGSNCFQLAAQLISQFTTFGQEFETDIGYRSAFYLQIYKYVIHNLILSCG